MFYWATLHHYGAEKDKEVQDEDSNKFWEKVDRLLLDGWVAKDMSVRNRNQK